MIKFDIGGLAGISLLAAKKDVRPFLNGVGLRDGHLIASNGHILGAIPADMPAGTDLSIPNDTVNLLLKGLTAKQKREGVITVVDGRISNGYTDMELPSLPYTTWLNVFPDQYTPEICFCYNWEYLALFNKMARTITGAKAPKVSVIHNGGKPANVLVAELPLFKGVIGPVRI